MNSTRGEIAPVRSEVTVPLPQHEAFELFTSHISRWWPFHQYSISGERTETVVFELMEGGEIFELAENSERHPWGTVTVFEPPTRVMFTWHPGRPAETAQEVEVVFVSTEEGTRVELEHRGWEILGEKAEESRNQYEGGWAHVLGECYGAAAREGLD